MQALDLRERLSSPASAGEIPQARIVDPERYQQRLASMGELIRVNLGCGEKPLPDYINIDFRELPEVDIVGDIRALPFEPGTLSEIASAHLIEHFKEHHLRTTILPYWKSLLRPGGILRIICPNWGAMLERLNDGRLPLASFKLLTFGAQDYEGDDHFAMYTPETLSNVLRDSGFTSIEVLATDRMNDICPEMEIVAHF
jgi:predicted SAM-dependent methyltransferase